MVIENGTIQKFGYTVSQSHFIAIVVVSLAISAQYTQSASHYTTAQAALMHNTNYSIVMKLKIYWRWYWDHAWY